MQGFTYDALPGRVVFGNGAATGLGQEIGRLGCKRVLFIASPRWRDFVAERLAELDDAGAGHFDNVVSQAPGELADELAELARGDGVDGVVALGGGGAVGLAKTTALYVDGVQIVAMPTTYSGSEMTAVIGITRDGLKRSVADIRVKPKTVIYDPALTVGLPPAVTGPSGMNALAHCVEALYAQAPVPVISLVAEEGIRALSEGVPAACARPDDPAPRARALYGAWLAGAAVATAGVGIHHRACHVLGGSFGIGHGAANSVMLPQAVKFNATAAPEAIGRAAAALGADDAAGAIFDLAQGMGSPTALKDLGFAAGDLDRAAALTVEMTPYNPRALDIAGVRALFDDAFHGRRP